MKKYYLYLNGGRVIEIDNSNYEMFKGIIQNDNNVLKCITFSVVNKFVNETIEMTIRTKDILAVEKTIRNKQEED